MIKRLTKLLEKQYDYILNEYKVSESIKKPNKFLKPGLILFAVSAVLYGLQLAGVIEFMNFILFFVSFILFVAFPLSKRQGYQKEALIFTPKYLIKRISRKEFTVISYNKITSFSHSENAIILKENGTVLELELTKYPNDLEILIDILEAKGKTFDKEKDYMVRPIEIIISDGVIKIEDLKLKETNTETITKSLFEKYNSLTPGFIREIIPKNAILYEVEVKGKDLYLTMSHFDVNGGHPENTSFNSISVEDCIMIFENYKVKEFLKRDSNEKGTKYDVVEITEENVISYLKKAVVHEWKFNANTATFIFVVGVGSVKIEFDFTEVIIGWNKVK